MMLQKQLTWLQLSVEKCRAIENTLTYIDKQIDT